jgi:hypothetical protein
MFWKDESLDSSRRFVRLMTTIWLPFTVVWLIVALWLGLQSMWWLMAPPGLLLVLIGWIREPGRVLQAIVAGVIFLAASYWLFGR